MDDLANPLHPAGLRHFNVEALSEIILLEDSGEDNLLQGLIQEYQSSTTVLPQKFREHQRSQEFPQLEMMAHSLKSSSLLLGLEILGHFCREVEHASRERKACPQAIDLLIVELERAKKELEVFVLSRLKAA